ncbi:hypothetical protein RERY_07620 [Rhodococcus erythropolis]|nr:hypothetical protein RERY_07620 [Rhodococcus erythropolis]
MAPVWPVLMKVPPEQFVGKGFRVDVRSDCTGVVSFEFEGEAVDCRGRTPEDGLSERVVPVNISVAISG